MSEKRAFVWLALAQSNLNEKQEDEDDDEDEDDLYESDVRMIFRCDDLKSSIFNRRKRRKRKRKKQKASFLNCNKTLSLASKSSSSSSFASLLLLLTLTLSSFDDVTFDVVTWNFCDTGHLLKFSSPLFKLGSSVQAASISSSSLDNALNSNFPAQNSTTDKTGMSLPQKKPKPKFIERPSAVTFVTEGHTILIRCATERPLDGFSWLKEGDYIFENGTRFDDHYERFTIIGNVTLGYYTMQLEKARKSDSGIYICQVNPFRFDSTMDTDDYKVATNLTVLEPTLTTTTSTTTTPTPLPSSHQQQTSTKIISNSKSDFAALNSDSNQLNNQQAYNYADQSNESSNNLNHHPHPHLVTVNQMQARDIQSLTKLSSSQLSSPSASANGRPTYSISGPLASSQHLNPINLFLSWPYVLLILAFVLMIANIYLIYSLIKRHTTSRVETSSDSTTTTTTTNSTTKTNPPTSTSSTIATSASTNEDQISHQENSIESNSYSPNMLNTHSQNHHHHHHHLQLQHQNHHAPLGAFGYEIIV